MNANDLKLYEKIHEGTKWFYPQERGLIAVWGREAVQFLNGLVTNDVAKIEDGATLLAAFPNAQGRLLAVVRVRRAGDEFLFETEGATRDKVFQNLFRFTFAGDFFVEDRSENYQYYSISDFGFRISDFEGIGFSDLRRGAGVFVPVDRAADFRGFAEAEGFAEIPDEVFETLRIERGIPLYGVDMDETTIVPELGLDDLISYTKGCYIGQEIIARIHFRGHVAKRLTGLIMSDSATAAGPDLSVPAAVAAGPSLSVPGAPATGPDLSVPGATATGSGAELKSADGKNAGRITSRTFSPKLQKTLALAYVRYDYLAEGTELTVNDSPATVKDLPFTG
ncbi:MAG: folate-binding protein YgfZ [Acidobacteria bacterium]|nr:folate-binding protein YgfZ [Acidobacteriota bacterium]